MFLDPFLCNVVRPKTSDIFFNLYLFYMLCDSVQAKTTHEFSGNRSKLTLSNMIHLFIKCIKKNLWKGDHIDGDDFLGKYVSLNPTIAEQIWIPDIFIGNYFQSQLGNDRILTHLTE